ncbi:DUF6771 family protein [Novosphingobium sp. YAF33]|uniref:DUF6771 family protein n=1 Tax=Novosphingobium sp. YAF33 TaxID=3233082 RepID=UPI003F9D075D
MVTDLSSTILQILERAPQWVRHDLESKELAIRTRAEETLAAMIASALQGAGLDADADKRAD